MLLLQKNLPGRLSLNISSESLGPVTVPDDEELFSKVITAWEQ
jgi:hypothetical protein